jgi:hypothetical protein
MINILKTHIGSIFAMQLAALSTYCFRIMASSLFKLYAEWYEVAKLFIAGSNFVIRLLFGK